MAKIHLQDAQTLAAGYTSSFRKVEIASILAFWALSFVIAWRAAGYWATHRWLIVAGVGFGYLFADFVSGFVHWMADTWGTSNMPVLGKTLVRPFREHHVDQKAITRHDYVETNGANCLVAVPVALAMALTPIAIDGWVSPLLFSVVSIGSMIFWVMMTNQIHKWSHLEPDETPWVVRALQRTHLILPPEHHSIHHTAPFDKYYSITTGWLNWPLTKLGFFRFLERIVTAVLGLVPRQDDIGLDAALAIAPPALAPPTLPGPGPVEQRT